MVNINPCVCFFDSGIGGLSLLYECVRKLPRVDFVYFADNHRVPYGNLSHEELIERVDGVFSEMNALEPAAAVAACNTVTAECIAYLREKYPFEIIGIQPAVKPAAANGNCTVLATAATANSAALKELTEKYGNGRTRVYACPDLAAYIEENALNPGFDDVVRLLPDVAAENVVLGCTHYIFVKDIIMKRYNCRVYDGLEGTAEQLRKKLGISDHSEPRAQKISFCGGDTAKNRDIFRRMLMYGGTLSQKVQNQHKKI